MNRKGLIALGVISTIAKIVAAVAFASLLARCTKNEPFHGHLEDKNPQFDEFEYSLGKSATQSHITASPAPESREQRDTTSNS